MAKTKPEISHELGSALADQFPIRVYRRRKWEFDRIWGYVIGLSHEWVALQQLSDGVYVDGVTVVRILDVFDVEDLEENRYIERAVKVLGRPDSNFQLGPDATTRDVLSSASRHGKMLGVRFEADSDDPLMIGRVTGFGERKFEMMLINAAGVWATTPTREWYGDVTQVFVGDRYSTALARFGDSYPLSP
ncbi:hypothetical protein [Microbacterium sp. LMI1x-1-1.1]|uniref:hypothetical protein n=1 Tax=Microbacterium sp. LMI1x-1-1.1 TaxID=3135246 RepID=UPI00343D96C4